MTMQPGGSSDPLTIRLYDKIEEMRSDVAAMASDVRNLATTIQPVVTQVGDHEMRIREVERTVEPMKDHEPRIAGLEKRVWMATGVTAFLAAGASAAATLLASGK